MAAAKAAAVKLTPLSEDVSHTPVTNIAKAVSVHTNKVSMAGPNIATKPSRTGSFVLAAPCAKGAVPIPASFENAPRLTPNKINPPTRPPKKASPLKLSAAKASVKISAKYFGTTSKLTRHCDLC